MRGMELMGYLSNSSTLNSIYLINKKHNWMLNDKQYKNMILNSYSRRPVVDPDIFFFGCTDHGHTMAHTDSNPNATFRQEQDFTC